MRTTQSRGRLACTIAIVFCTTIAVTKVAFVNAEQTSVILQALRTRAYFDVDGVDTEDDPLVFSETLSTLKSTGNLGVTIAKDYWTTDASPFLISPYPINTKLGGPCADDLSMTMYRFQNVGKWLNRPYRISLQFYANTNRTTAYRTFVILQTVNTTASDPKYFMVGCESPSANYSVPYNRSTVYPPTGTLTGGICVPTIADFTALLRGDPDAFVVRGAPINMAVNNKYFLHVRMFRNDVHMSVVYPNNTAVPSNTQPLGYLRAQLPMPIDWEYPNMPAITAWGFGGGHERDGNVTCVTSFSLVALDKIVRFPISQDSAEPFAKFRAGNLELFEDSPSSSTGASRLINTGWNSWAYNDTASKYSGLANMPLPRQVDNSVGSANPSAAMWLFELPGEMRTRALFAFTANGTASFGVVYKAIANVINQNGTNMFLFFGCLPGSTPYSCRPAIVSSDATIIERYGYERLLVPGIWYRLEATFSKVASLNGDISLRFGFSLSSSDGLDVFFVGQWSVVLSKRIDINIFKIGFSLGCRNLFCEGDAPPAPADPFAPPPTLVDMRYFVDNFQMNLLKEAADRYIATVCPMNCVCSDERILLSCNYTVSGASLIIVKSAIVGIHENAFDAYADVLTTLIITNGVLLSIPSTLLGKLKKLDYLDLKNNMLSTIDFLNSTSLTKVDLSFNLISGRLHPDTFRNVPNLRDVNLVNNRITALPSRLFHYNPYFDDLDAGGNLISVLEPGMLTSRTGTRFMNSLRFSGNNLGGRLNMSDPFSEDLPPYMFNGIIVSTTLDLSLNGIRRIRNSLRGVQSPYIMLGLNNISYIHERAFEDNGVLYYLGMQDNALTEIPAQLFAKKPNLGYLYFQNNQISRIEDGALSSLPSLAQLSLNGNKLASLPDYFMITHDASKLIQVPEDVYVDLTGNPGLSAGNAGNVYVGSAKCPPLRYGSAVYDVCVFGTCQGCACWNGCFCKAGRKGTNCDTPCASNGMLPVAMANVTVADRFGTGCLGRCTDCVNSDYCDPVIGCHCLSGWEGPNCNKEILVSESAAAAALQLVEVTTTTATLTWESLDCPNCEYRLKRTQVIVTNVCQSKFSHPDDPDCYVQSEASEFYLMPYFSDSKVRVDTGLFPNTNYRYRLQVRRNTTSMYMKTNFTAITTTVARIPPPVKISAAFEIHPGVIRLGWETVTDTNGFVIRYEVYRDGLTVAETPTNSSQSPTLDRNAASPVPSSGVASMSSRQTPSPAAAGAVMSIDAFSPAANGTSAAASMSSRMASVTPSPGTNGSANGTDVNPPVPARLSNLKLLAAVGRDVRYFDDTTANKTIKYTYVVLAVVDGSTENAIVNLKNLFPLDNGTLADGVISGVALAIPQDAPSPSLAAISAAGPGDSSKTIAIAVSVPIVVVLIACVALLRVTYVKMRDKRHKRLHEDFLARHAGATDEFGGLTLDKQSIILQDELGAGEFGIVYRARVAAKDGKIRVCAAKTMREGSSIQDREEFIAEATIMKNLSHPHVMALVAVSIQEEPMMLIFEYIPHGNLKRFLQMIPDEQQRLPVTIRLLMQFSHQLAVGMDYLASSGIVHRDLAARNVMLDRMHLANTWSRLPILDSAATFKGTIIERSRRAERSPSSGWRQSAFAAKYFCQSRMCGRLASSCGSASHLATPRMRAYPTPSTWTTWLKKDTASTYPGCAHPNSILSCESAGRLLWTTAHRSRISLRRLRRSCPPPPPLS
eukprot:Opistho-2@35377